jgi:hypothetical protein
LQSFKVDNFSQFFNYLRQTACLQKTRAFLDDQPQQPADVVAHCAQHCVQRIPFWAPEVAAIHAVIGHDAAFENSQKSVEF